MVIHARRDGLDFAALVRDQAVCGKEMRTTDRINSRFLNRKDFWASWQQERQNMREGVSFCLECLARVEQDKGESYFKVTARLLGETFLACRRNDPEKTQKFMDSFFAENPSKDLVDAMGAFFVDRMRKVSDDAQQEDLSNRKPDTSSNTPS